ncbi:DMT family transporter [Actinokineospora iranica]|uniref:Permease of the drug/metabolite transporter (DMT) superfamily n=1 Tax=Actinokineospora iranica TaxID=1271860 RepID=A0A1G6QZ54_9PSEU|nr:DMT family transporter [Actinokineospora iranica]SDC97085.1 Permease of the drug/metabolite transporter (DMT) superfamily [Actinokineospora iranica]
MIDSPGYGRAYLQLVTTMALWGSAFASSKIVVDAVPHSVAAVLRFGGGALVLLLVLKLFGGDRSGEPPRAKTRAGLAGLLGVFGYNTFFFWGLSLAPSLDGTIIVPVLSPILTTAFVVLSGREKVSTARVIGLSAGLGGAILFFMGVGGDFSGGTDRLLGDFVYLLGAVCWSAYTLTVPHTMRGIESLRATTYATVAGAVALALFAAPSVPDVAWETVPTAVWLNVGYLVLGPTVVAYILYYSGIRSLGATTASIMMFTSPVFGAICSVVFLHETFSLLQGVGAAVMLVGAVLAVTNGKLPRRNRPVAEPEPEPKPAAEAKATVDATT